MTTTHNELATRWQNHLNHPREPNKPKPQHIRFFIYSYTVWSMARATSVRRSSAIHVGVMIFIHKNLYTILVVGVLWVVSSEWLVLLLCIALKLMNLHRCMRFKSNALALARATRNTSVYNYYTILYSYPTVCSWITKL